MTIEKLQKLTIKKLIEVEKREPYMPQLSAKESLKRKYNMSRSLSDYKMKFPDLVSHLKPGIHVLEIGAGDGIALNEMKSIFQISATGTNINTDSEKAFIKAFAHKLPFCDNLFDVVISINSITWEPNQKKSIKEVIRVLKSGGVAFVNLYKFSEISRLWFGDSFLNAKFKLEYQKKFEFDEFITENFIDVRSEPSLDEFEIVSKGYFITIRKPTV